MRIWDGINVIPDDRVPEGFVGIDGPNGIELIRIDVTGEGVHPMTEQPDATGAMTEREALGALIRKWMIFAPDAADAIAGAVLAAGYRLAAGPTKAEVLAAISKAMDQHGYTGQLFYASVRAALTALWPAEQEGE